MINDRPNTYSFQSPEIGVPFTMWTVFQDIPKDKELLGVFSMLCKLTVPDGTVKSLDFKLGYDGLYTHPSDGFALFLPTQVLFQGDSNEPETLVKIQTSIDEFVPILVMSKAKSHITETARDPALLVAGQINKTRAVLGRYRLDVSRYNPSFIRAYVLNNGFIDLFELRRKR